VLHRPVESTTRSGRFQQISLQGLGLLACLCAAKQSAEHTKLQNSWNNPAHRTSKLALNMSEYELFEIAASYQALSGTWMGLFLTVFSAFLVVAYAVGKELSAFQASVIISSFVTFSLLCIWGVTGTVIQCVRLYQEITLLNPERDFFLNNSVLALIDLVLFTAVSIAVWFMVDARRQP
jgi:hypothetical protein